MSTTRSASAWRVRPRIWIGFAIWVGYIVLINIVQGFTGIPYNAWGDSGSNLFFGAGISLIVGTIALAITATLLGWWRPAILDRQRSHHRWPIIAPALMVVALAINLASTDWGSYDVAFFSASIVLLLFGFTEEMTTRGLLLVGLRSRLSEVWVWFLTSAAFAAMHFTNILVGAPVAQTFSQVGLAFLGGTIFYIRRRTTGSLIWAMVLHGLWDFSTFAEGHGTPSAFAAFGGTVYLIAGVLALASVAFVIRGADEKLDQRGVQA